MNTHTIGLVVPPSAGEVPEDATSVYPGVRFVAEGLGLKEMSVEGYESVIYAVEDASTKLRDRGAEVIALMGTSLSFYRGKDFHDELIRALGTSTNLPTTTMSQGIVDALRHTGVTRPAVASAYTQEVHQKLLTFLEEEKFTAAGSAHLSISSIAEVHRVSGDTVLDLGHEATRNSSEFDGILISCGGLTTADAVTRLEDEYQVPVVSSPLAGLWRVVQLLEQPVKGHHRSALFAGSERKAEEGSIA